MNAFIEKYGKPDVHFRSQDPHVLSANRNLTMGIVRDVVSPHMSRDVLKNLVTNPGLTSEHLHHMIEHVNENDMGNVIQRIPRHIFDQTHFDKIFDKGNPRAIRMTMNRHSNFLKPHHIDSLIDRNIATDDLARFPILNTHQVDRLLDTKDEQVATAIAINHPNLEPHHIDKLIKFPGVFIGTHLSQEKKLQPHHIDELLNKHSSQLDGYLAQNPVLRPQHIDRLMGSGNQEVQRNLAGNPALNETHIDKLLDHKDPVLDSRLARNTSLHPHHVHQLLRRNEILPMTIRNLVSKQNLHPQHIDDLIDRGFAYEVSAEHSKQKLDPHHIDRLLDFNDRNILHNLKSKVDQMTPEQSYRLHEKSSYN